MKMLITVNISKGFAAWKQIAKGMAPEMEKVGVKMDGEEPTQMRVRCLCW